MSINRYAANALAREPGFPKRNWQEDLIEDRDGDHEICQFCGITRIRFVHILSHPQYHRPIRVGCVCVEHLTGESAASVKQREGAIKRETDRKRVEALKNRQWAEMALDRWKETRPGEFAFYYGDAAVTVRREGPSWRYFLCGNRSKAAYGQPKNAMLEGTLAMMDQAS